MNAGVLPYCGPYVLLGLESNGWSAFGGGPNENEDDERLTARREFHEETCRMFSPSITDRMHMILETNTPTGRPFKLYGLRLNRRCAVEKFYENRRSEIDPSFLEKTHVRWFHIDSLPKRLRGCFQNDIRFIRMKIKMQLTDRKRMEGSDPFCAVPE